jgi:hypothetical protein
MGLDARLANVELLALAAMRAKQRQQAEPSRKVTCRVVYYDARGIEPEEEGESYTYYESEAGPAWRADPCE